MLSSLAGQFRAFNTARFTIHEDEATIRIDRALRERLQVPQSYVQRAIRNREVSVIRGIAEQQIVYSHPHLSQSFRLQKDDVLTVQNPPHPKESTRKTDPDRVTPPTDNLLARLKNAVIFQDKDFIVLNKPAGLVSQGPSPSISHALPWLRSEIESRPPSLVHRLDKWTSGVLVIARNRQSAIEFSRAMKPPGKSGEIDVFLTDDEHFTSKVSRDPAIGKRSLTKYELLCSDVCNGQHLSLVRFYPETGRKHQLRVVAATCLNSPILGDTIYDPESRDQSKYGHLFLHASTLSITTEDYINRWEADLPYYFRELMKQLNWNST